MSGQVRRVQTCSDYQVNKLWRDKKKRKEDCLQKSRMEQFNSSVGRRRKQSLYVQYRYRFLSKNSLWLIISREKKGLSPLQTEAVKFLPGFGWSVHLHSRARQPLQSPKKLWPLVPALTLTFGLTSCYILTSSRWRQTNLQFQSDERRKNKKEDED